MTTSEPGYSFGEAEEMGLATLFLDSQLLYVALGFIVSTEELYTTLNAVEVLAHAKDSEDFESYLQELGEATMKQLRQQLEGTFVNVPGDPRLAIRRNYLRIARGIELCGYRSRYLPILITTMMIRKL